MANTEDAAGSAHLGPRVLVVAVLLAAVAHSPTLRAEPGSAPRDKARLDNELGIELLAKQRFDEAAVALERSVAMFESPSAYYNLALAYHGLRQERRALAKLERFLALAPEDSPKRSDADRLLQRILDGLAPFTLEVRGPVQAASIDGELVPLGQGTGSVTVQLDLGPHTLVLSRAGHRDVRETFELTEARRATTRVVAAPSEPLFATLVLESEDAAVLEVDGLAAGVHVARVRLELGRHAVSARVEGRAVSQVVEVRATGGAAAEGDVVALGPDEERRVVLVIPPEPPRLLSRWWFWAGAAVVAGAALTGAVLLSEPAAHAYDGGASGVVVRN